jgi:hypothetical protein
LEGSTTSENNVAANLPSISETKNDPFAQLVGPKQKAFLPHIACILFYYFSMQELNYISNLNVILILCRVLKVELN